MKKKKNQYKVGNRASICNWNLTFRFYTKEQCQRFIKKFMKLEIPVSFSYYTRLGENGPTEHVIEITDFSWASNLTIVAKMLESVDHEM